MAMNANRTTGLVSRKNQKTTERLSSGYRINRAADDAAGLAISEKMRRQIRGLTRASANAQDGISLVQVADGALQEMHAIVQRGNELAVKAANGTLTDEDRLMIDAEIQQLKQALDESAHTTTFNEINLFPTDGQSPKA
ncbi:MAG: flagellin, partial [Lachnospiraceae bacterium]|nr:flagellin [Lachnospiraceae bacterium]